MFRMEMAVILYTFKYALTINNHHYYLYREYHELDGESNATGNDYVVNYMSMGMLPGRETGR